REEDFIEHLFVASTHSWMLFFTVLGKCYWLRVYEIPEGGRTTKGRAIQNLIAIEKEDKIRAYISIKNIVDEEYLKNNFILFATKKGVIKKTALEAYSRPRQKGIIAINIAEDDQLLEAVLTNDTSEVIIATKFGQAIRFAENRVRSMGRNSTGVRGVRLNEEVDDEVIGMVCTSDLSSTVLVVSEKGYGKRSLIEDYRVTNRGGKGVKTLNITEKTGKLVAILNVDDTHDLMIITKNGILIRISVAAEIRTMGRATQGVRLIKLNPNDEIASIARLDEMEKEDDEEMEGSSETGDISETENEAE